MAFTVDAHLLNPAVLRALTRTSRVLTETELAQLHAELSTDPQNVGYKPEGSVVLKGAHELTALLNTSGRAEALFGSVLLEAADVLQAVNS